MPHGDVVWSQLLKAVQRRRLSYSSDGSQQLKMLLFQFETWRGERELADVTPAWHFPATGATIATRGLEPTHRLTDVMSIARPEEVSCNRVCEHLQSFDHTVVSTAVQRPF